MRRPIAAVALLAVAMLVSACAASQAPGWTFAPPTPSPTAGPSQSAGASGAPAASESAAAASASAPAASSDASAGASAPAASGGAAGGNVINLTAQGIQWTTTSLKAPANTAFTIHFDNQDQGVPHNLNIKDASGQDVFKSDLVTGPAQADFQIKALPAGTYTFVCNVHPGMQGTLTVGP